MLRALSQKEFTNRYPISGGIVTEDRADHRSFYNCNGFSFGICHPINIGHGPDDGPMLMRRMGYLQTLYEDLMEDDDVVALYDKGSGDRWHTAKRVRGPLVPPDWYESKCGTDVPVELQQVGLPADPLGGLRIAHHLLAIQSMYGTVHSYWKRICSPEADEMRRGTLRVNAVPDDCDPIHDSSEELSVFFVHAYSLEEALRGHPAERLHYHLQERTVAAEPCIDLPSRLAASGDFYLGGLYESPGALLELVRALAAWRQTEQRDRELRDRRQ